MRIGSTIVSLASGLIAGVLLVVSCGDDSPGHVDAAGCDCPAAEPPIQGRIIFESQTAVIPPNGRGGQGTGCPEGSVRLTGSCTTEAVNPLRDVTLEQSGFYDVPGNRERGWSCEFKNNEATPVTIKVSVSCLLPPS